jgi:hypothetical protein
MALPVCPRVLPTIQPVSKSGSPLVRHSRGASVGKSGKLQTTETRLRIARGHEAQFVGCKNCTTPKSKLCRTSKYYPNPELFLSCGAVAAVAVQPMPLLPRPLSPINPLIALYPLLLPHKKTESVQVLHRQAVPSRLRDDSPTTNSPRRPWLNPIAKSPVPIPPSTDRPLTLRPFLHHQASFPLVFHPRPCSATFPNCRSPFLPPEPSLPPLPEHVVAAEQIQERCRE